MRVNLCPSPTPAQHLAPPQANPDSVPATVCQRTWADEVEAYARGLQKQLREMRMGKATRNPRESVLRWAFIKPDGTFYKVATGEVLTWRSRHRARLCRDPGERVVRVRVTVEVVDGH